MSELVEIFPVVVDVDGRECLDHPGVRLIGKAYRQPDGEWLSLADVWGSLARVEITLRFEPPDLSGAELDENAFAALAAPMVCRWP